MSRELVVLTQRRPALLQLHHYDESDRLLVQIRDPFEVAVPDEPERLLGVRAPVPVWWTHIRAAASPPEAVDLAERLARQLADAHDGTIWRGNPV